MVVDNRQPAALTVGVLGGLGPAATVDFMSRILELTPAGHDQDHLRLLVDQNPRVPSRQRALLEGGESPAPALAEMARGLEAQGADFLVMPCNTAHAWEAEIVAAVGVPFVGIVSATVAAVPEGIRRIGVLETPALAKSKLYPRALAGRGLTPVGLGDAGCNALMQLAYAVKRGERGDTLCAAMIKLVQTLVDDGAEAIVAACTEVPLMLAAADVAVPLISSTDALARRTVALATGALPLPDRKGDAGE